jgi:hypothetical protein
VKFIKFSEFYIICTTIPDFYLSPDKDKMESGFLIEKRLLPTLFNTQTIYAKDYELIKHLDKITALNIGKSPAEKFEQLSLVKMRKNHLK